MIRVGYDLRGEVHERGWIAALSRTPVLHPWYMLLAAVLLAGCIALLTSGETRLFALVVGVTLSLTAVMLRGLTFGDALRLRTVDGRLALILSGDPAPSMITDDDGRILYRNQAAADRMAAAGSTLTAALAGHFANPGAVLHRLHARAMSQGAAREDLVSRAGQLRLTALRVGGQRCLWRLEDFSDLSPARGAETLSLPMLVANRAGVILFANEAMRRLLGDRPKRLATVFGDTPLNPGEEIDLRTATGTTRAILAEVPGSGERREIYLLPAPPRTGAEASPTDFEYLPVPLMRFAADGSLRDANQAARDLTGVAAGSDLAVHDLFEGLGRPVADWLADVASGRLPGGAEVLRLRQGDDESYLQITLRRVVEQGRPGVLAVLQDATALKTLEAQFVQSQKMQAIGQLAGGIAHDFNNLLTAISGHCDLLMLRHDREDPDYADLVQVHQNANRAASLVGQLLAFSRKQTLQPERIFLEEALSDLTHLLNRLVGEKVSLHLSHAPGLGPIRADRRKLEQVLLNLVVNARDAMIEGGTIRIGTQALDLSEELRRDRAIVPPGQYALIRVEDTGTGIPSDRLQKIFEPFYTTKRAGEGTGLGLSTAYGIVKQSGGFIFVDSVVGQGSCFMVLFPIHTAPPEPVLPKPAPIRIAPRQGEGIVLLVEDEAPVRAFASRALRMRGYTVLEADSAEAALTLLQDASLQVDVFVTDVVMPGLDGPTWVKTAMETRPDVRVIFVSGYAEDCLSESQARMPNSVFLPKPFSLTDLTATVQRQMG